MKLKGNIRIGNRTHAKGTDTPWYFIYPFFLIHMLVFGGSGFLMAYSDPGAPLLFLYAHGGLAILVYTAFYVAMFGRDEVKWMFINSGLGALGIYSQIGWLMSKFGKDVSDYPIYVHVIPFLYFVLYTFLIRQAVLDLLKVREDEGRRRIVERVYVVAFVAFYVISYFMGRT